MQFGSMEWRRSGSPVLSSDWMSSEPMRISWKTRRSPRSNGPPLHTLINNIARYRKVGCNVRAQNRDATDMLNSS